MFLGCESWWVDKLIPRASRA